MAHDHDMGSGKTVCRLSSALRRALVFIALIGSTSVISGVVVMNILLVVFGLVMNICGCMIVLLLSIARCPGSPGSARRRGYVEPAVLDMFIRAIAYIFFATTLFLTINYIFRVISASATVFILYIVLFATTYLGLTASIGYRYHFLDLKRRLEEEQ